MLLLRLMLAWLIMAAIPLQGVAAVSMAFCKGSHPQRVAAAQDGGDQHLGTQRDGASRHSHAAVSPQVKPALDMTGDAKSLPDAGHKCGVCASCCHSLAMAEVPRWPAVAPIPQPEPPEVVLRIYAALSPLPDKPPRA
jgi:hypothetical protein